MVTFPDAVGLREKMLFLKQKLTRVRAHPRRGKKGVTFVSEHLRRVREGGGGERAEGSRPMLPIPQLASVGEGGEEVIKLGVQPERMWDIAIATHHSGKQLVHQLLQNALDATAKNKGMVYVRWTPQEYEGKGRGFRFIVADEGEGIPKEKLRLLLDLGASEKPERALGGFGVGKAAAFGVASKLTLLLGHGRDEEGRLQLTQIRVTRDQVKQGFELCAGGDGQYIFVCSLVSYSPTNFRA
jgi:hypothetical protein